MLGSPAETEKDASWGDRWIDPAGQANTEMENDRAVTAGSVRQAKCDKLIFMLRNTKGKQVGSAGAVQRVGGWQHIERERDDGR